MAILLFEKVKLLKAAIEIGTGLGPCVRWKMNISVCPRIRQIPDKVVNVRFSRKPFLLSHTSPVSGFTLAKAYNTCVSLSTGRSCGLNFRPYMALKSSQWRYAKLRDNEDRPVNVICNSSEGSGATVRVNSTTVTCVAVKVGESD